jgi:hypothetical protein
MSPIQERTHPGNEARKVFIESRAVWAVAPSDLTAADFFLWGYLKAQVFTHTLPDINSLKNAICQEITNVTQDTLCRFMASVPGRWQQYLDCHGGHLLDVLKT